MEGIRGFVIDLDGVMYTGDTAIPGAKEAIQALTGYGYRFRFLSNTTRKSRQTISDNLARMGITVPKEAIVTPSVAATRYLKASGKSRCCLIVTGDSDRDFEGIHICADDERADYVIVGDAGDNLNYRSLNNAFRQLMNGAELIALESDRYWMAPDGLSLSAGPFIRALEFASGVTAEVMGKPSRDFFSWAFRDMNLEPGKAAMIGDDIKTDIGGAQSAGLKGILVRTGKYREDLVRQSGITPDLTLDSIAGLGEVLHKLW